MGPADAEAFGKGSGRPARCELAKQKGGGTVSEDILTTTVDDPDITTMEPVTHC
jgi:hypothetical protein